MVGPRGTQHRNAKVVHHNDLEWSVRVHEVHGEHVRGLHTVVDVLVGGVLHRVAVVRLVAGEDLQHVHLLNDHQLVDLRQVLQTRGAVRVDEGAWRRRRHHHGDHHWSRRRGSVHRRGGHRRSPVRSRCIGTRRRLIRRGTVLRSVRGGIVWGRCIGDRRIWHGWIHLGRAGSCRNGW